MKKNRRILIIAGVVCILAAVLAGAYWNTRQEPGSLQLSEVDASRPLAEFHGQPVYVKDVERHMYNLAAVGQSNQQTAEESLTEILQNMVLYEEAIRLGYAATQSEVDALVENSKQAYATPEGKEMMNQYCEEVNLTIDEYFKYLGEQAPRTIARQKLLDAVGKEYCEDHGLNFTKVNPPKEMIDARDAYVAELFAQAQGDIIYYTTGT